MIDDAVLTVDAAFPRIEAVKVLEGFTILVCWEDGRENVVDLAPTIFSLRLYAPRDDASLLRSVHRVNPSVIAWGEDDVIDMHVSELERLAGEAMETAGTTDADSFRRNVRSIPMARAAFARRCLCGRDRLSC